MNRAFEAKQRAYASQDSTWQYLQRMRDSYGPQIEQLNSFQETAFQNTNRQGRAKIDIYYGPNGPFGPGHHHAVAYRESPYDFVADNLR